MKIKFLLKFCIFFLYKKNISIKLAIWNYPKQHREEISFLRKSVS